MHFKRNHGFFAENDVQLNKVKPNVNIFKNAKKSIYIEIYNKQIQDVLII
jgi:hypothetical protein